MTILQYLDIIKLFCITENIKKSSDAQLDDLVEEILLNSNKCYLNLFDFFSALSANQKTSGKDKKANQDSIKQITDHLDLLFVSDNNTIENVCFANSNEMRPEFRQTFTIIDIMDYCCAILHSATFDTFSGNEVIRIPITSDSKIFWQLVKVGFELRYKMLKI
jgi:hypothetical protein